LTRLLLARDADGRHYDGRIARPALVVDAAAMTWDLARDTGGRSLVDTGALARHGELHQLPARGVTGPDWDGSAQSWHACPSHYDAVHFHADDLYDAGWPVTAELVLPATLPSGIYAFRLEQDGEVDRVPLFVRPAAGAPTADVALLLPSCTYMAYANHRMLFEGADFVAARGTLTPEHEYLRERRDVGLSCYEKHADGSGVMFSSRRRPVLQMRPGADRWNFTPDTCLNAFLEHLGMGHDVLSDEDLHHDGPAALAPYRVLVTGTHPEYWSTAMLDALEDWLRQGGRLMYLGGNGFYWRVAFSDAWPGALELRRAEDGVRNWQTEPGESYHAFGGEYGGLWRRLGRAPNETVGVGFAAQGFEQAAAYERQPGAADPRAAWILAGVDGERIGTSGLGGGAAGQEVDRYDVALGSPPHALVLASATAFGADMIRTKEEFEAAMVPAVGDPMVRADLVFFETGGGGAVFSVGSISWFGALARNGYDNDVATITANVVRRFADPTPFAGPSGDD
ncbi:MAG: N,N-dimethylformamidase beta subunit family domain-containing protein, partial [Gammaproteobacteria bacterium]